MHHSEFWDVSLREYDVITRARIKARDSGFEARRVLNQELGILMQYAFHDPKKMPDFTRAGRKAPVGSGSPEQKLQAGFMSLYFMSRKGV